MNLLDRDVPIDNAYELDARREDPLVTAVQAGVPEAFAQLYETYSPRLYGTIAKITKNPEDAQDALQETFLRAHLRVHAFEGRSSIYSWMSRIAINCALMILRKRRTRAEVLFDPQPDHRRCDATVFEVRDCAPNPEEAYDLRQRQTKTLRAIRRLDPKLQGALRMRMRHEWSVKEISQALKISEAAAKSRLYRARQQLSTRNADRRSFAIHHLQPLSVSFARDNLLSASSEASLRLRDSRLDSANRSLYKHDLDASIPD